MRKILFSRESECIQPLRELVEKQLRKTLILWALECAKPYLAYFETNQPDENRPREVLEIANRWARGQVKMPEAKKAIHAAHNAAAAVGDKTRHDASVMAAGRAIGHAAATVHVETHALGLVFYGLTSKTYSVDDSEAATIVETEIHNLYSRLLFWEEQISQDIGPWADFLRNDTLPNKEMLLRIKYDRANNNILLSTDTKNWETQSAIAGNWAGSAFDGKKIVCCGVNNYVMVSP